MSWRGKTVLVTGSSGFIGSHLTDRLALEQADVIGFDIVPPKYASERHNVKHIILDITSGLCTISRKIDVIFHLAAYAVPNLCETNPSEAFKVNVQGTYNMLRFASRNKIPKFVFTSSALLYGRIPIYLPIDEKHPTIPTDNTYCITKKLGEDLCSAFQSNTDLSVTILRLFNTFGPRQDPDYLIPTIIHQAITKKSIELWSDKPTRDFNYIDNTVDALLTVGSSAIGGLYNVGSGKEVKISEITYHIASRLGAQVRFLNKDVIGPLRLCCDNSKICDTFGWKPKTSFSEGIDKTLTWYETQGMMSFENK